jgi:hypothetical protein
VNLHRLSRVPRSQPFAAFFPVSEVAETEATILLLVIRVGCKQVRNHVKRPAYSFHYLDTFDVSRSLT